MTKSKVCEENGKEKLKKIPSLRIEGDSTPRGLSLIFVGIIGVAEFSAKEVKLMTKRGSIQVIGENIEIVVYEGNTVELSGRIETVNIGYPRKERSI